MAIEAPIDFVGNFDKLTGQLEGQKEALKKAFETIAAAFFVDKIKEGIEAIVEKASEAEQATIRMGNALRGTGDGTSHNIALFQEFAEQMAASSKFTIEEIESQVSLSKQFGVTNKEATQLIKTAVNLATATGEDLNTAVLRLGQTLDGNAGRLARQFPILQKFTEEQLRQGAAIKALGEIYRGSAAAALDSYAGKQNQVGKSFDEIEKSLGKVIIQNPEVLSNLARSAEAFAELAKVIERNSVTLSNWLTIALKGTRTVLVETAAGLAGPLGVLIEKWTTGFAEVSDKVELVGGGMTELVKRFNPITGKMEEFGASSKKAASDFHGLGEQFDFVRGKMIDGFDEGTSRASISIKKLKEELKTLTEKLKDVGSTDIAILDNKYDDHLKTITDSFKYGLIDLDGEINRIGQLEVKYAKEAADVRKKEFNELYQKLQAIYQSPAKTFFSDSENSKGGNWNLNEGQQSGIAAGAGGLNYALQGAQGARDLVAGTVSAVAEAYLGPVGKVFGDIVKQLSMGPEYVRAMIDQFTDALPEMIANVIKSLPVIFEKFAEFWPKLIDGLIDHIPDIIEALIKGIPKFWEALITAWPRLIGRLIEGAGQFVWKIIEGAGQFVGKILDGAAQFIQKLLEGLNNSFGGAGGTGSFGGLLNPVGALTGHNGGGFHQGGATGTAIGYVLPISNFFKAGGGGEQQSSLGPDKLQVNMHVAGKAFASTIVDLQKQGYKLVPT